MNQPTEIASSGSKLQNLETMIIVGALINQQQITVHEPVINYYYLLS